MATRQNINNRETIDQDSTIKINKKRLLRRFAAYYKPHKKLFILDISTATFQSILSIFIPLIVSIILKTYLPDKNFTMMAYAISAIFMIAIVIAIANYINIRWGHILGARMETDMRSDLFAHLQKLSFSYFDNTKTGHIVSRISNDLFNVSEIAHHGPEDFFISLFTLLGAFSCMFYLNTPLAFVTLIPLPFLLLWGMTYQGRMRNRYRHIRTRIADINSSVENSIQGIREVKSFANEELELERFDDVNSEFKFAKEKMYTVMAAFHSAMMFILNCYPLTLIAGGVIVVANGLADIADILTFMIFLRFIMNPIRRMVNFSEQFQQGVASFERFVEIMDIEPEICDHKNAIPLEAVKGNIVFNDVTFKYNEESNDILNNINLDIKAGATVALVGESGAGKTTLAAIIPRFYEPQKGTISIDDINIMDLQQQSLRDNIGIVRQNPFMFDTTIAENILFGKPNASEAEMVEAARNANILEFINSLPERFNTLVGEHGVKLSGGQKQRVSIARVFLKNPPILIFDEATSSLDTESESLIKQSMNILCENRTTIIIAHRLSTIKHADMIYVLKNGSIVESGNHKSLIKKEGYYHTLHQI